MRNLRNEVRRIVREELSNTYNTIGIDRKGIFINESYSLPKNVQNLIWKAQKEFPHTNLSKSPMALSVRSYAWLRSVRKNVIHVELKGSNLLFYTNSKRNRNKPEIVADLIKGKIRYHGYVINTNEDFEKVHNELVRLGIA